MAQALMKLAYGDAVFVDSVGLKHEEGQDEVDSFAAAVIDEAGGDLTGFHPKTFAELEDESFDVVISLTPEAQHRAVEIAREHAVDIEYWPTHDPTLVTGSREQILDAYREVRDELARRIEERFGRPSTFGG
jgi:protein-tyrosine-phosphatase